jgi:hypothetical protein
VLHELARAKSNVRRGHIRGEVQLLVVEFGSHYSGGTLNFGGEAVVCLGAQCARESAVLGGKRVHGYGGCYRGIWYTGSSRLAQ